MTRKGILLIMREKRTFMIFTLIYTILIFLTSLFLDFAFDQGFSSIAGYLVAIFFLTSLILSLLYAWILVSRKRRNWATLKCIGYTNKNIISLVSGIILFTTLFGLFIVLEILFHYTAIFTYLESANIQTGLPGILIGLLPVVATAFIFIFVQLISIALIYRKVLKVRPIVALKRVGE
ncbi:MAG: FtsX-like permease family protein [Candidatus Lokiarchaeota archaeon]|nr:FtsX-like permease family protein [Candidatus Lokiarchaeota archaeon]MBD3201254.1 FtsX-like permease family protein [Candidatus Lokiarchaeota archaeon]